MKRWDQLFVRTGWILEKKAENVFCCNKETELNTKFLIKSLEKANVTFRFENGLLYLPEAVISEEKWLEAIDFYQRGIGGYWFVSGSDEPRLEELDKYIAGFVRQLNRLGFVTTGSCDGHGRRFPYIMFSSEENQSDIEKLLAALGMKEYFIRKNRLHLHITLRIERVELLELAERLSFIDKEWLSSENNISIRKQLFLQLLEELLEIPGESGNEEKVREVVFKKLTRNVDYITIDRAGNILAEKTYGNGYGPTILLNAHLDTCERIIEGRKIIKEGSIWSSSEGILGADDRAGIAVILHLAEHLKANRNFNGKIKFIFTVQEEKGLVGAKKVDATFLWGVDGAIVVDRRGTGDIVTSCGNIIPFCHKKYGEFFEQAAKDAGLTGWQMTPGGSSDTAIWASHGIQSVNVSAGYFYEHTDAEILNVEAAYETVKLLTEVFNHGRKFRRAITEINCTMRVAN